MMASKQNVYLISLGCAKNLVDSENALGVLAVNGFPIVSSLEEAEIAIINTCAFIQSAVEETIDTVLEVAARKRSGKLKKLFVMGCFVQRYGYELLKEMPEVDGWLGTGEICRIADILDSAFHEVPPFLIAKPGYLADHRTPRVQTTPFYSGYLKIAEGCSHRCTYCTISRLRGDYRSRDLESILLEAEGMVERGVKEINLIAQDSTMYGNDLAEDVGLEDLLERLLEIRGISWIRVLYSHPYGISDRLLELVDGQNAICSYLDIPLQHVNLEILEAMGRAPKEETPWQLIERIRSKTGDLSLRTTMMVGFPGETDKSFRELCDFVTAASFDHLGVFVFSPERGTSAARFENRVERKVAEERLDSIMRLQAEISERKRQKMVGQIVPVLVEGQSPETDLLLTGRTAGMAPDVDGRVLINKGQAMLGDIVPVMIRQAYAYDVIGEIL
ncbi:MAG: 30S ribosomal protein S12 methylthiotransferase RimO [Desulfobacteraceae bacterium]|jgi:ribosomal protein S12 methylthiotransferase